MCPNWVGRKKKKEEYAEDIVDIVELFFKDKYEIPENELMRLNKNTLANLYCVLKELKQKRIDEFI